MLTTRQEQFCQEYFRTRSFGRAYRAAYNHLPELTDKAAEVAGRQVWKSDEVKARVKELANEAAGPAILTVETAIRRFLAIADADPNELSSVVVNCCRRCWGPDHARQWRAHEYEDALDAAATTGRMPDLAGGLGYDATRDPHPDCPACDGRGERHVLIRDTTQLGPDGLLIYGGAEQTKNGIKVNVADRMKALENACKLAGLFTDRVVHSGAIGAMTTHIDAEKLGEKSTAELAKLYQSMVGGKLT